MAFQGINTGSAPNDGTGDTLLVGGIKVNSNFTELYNLLGDGSSLAVGVVTNTGDASGVTGITTLIQAGSNISVTTNSGISTIAYTGVANTANISANTVNVSGIVTATSFNGSGASLTGVLTALNLNGADASGVTGITTLIQAGSNITVETTAGITTIASTASGVTTANVSTNTLNVVGVSTFQGNATHGDDVKGIFGDGNDLQIYHNGSNSIINDVGTGDLYIGGNANVNITNAALDEFKAKFITDGGVELYHNNNKKLDINDAGIKVVGDIRVGNGVNIRLVDDSGAEVHVNCINNGSVELYYNGIKKFETTASGVSVTDDLIVAGVSTFQGRMIGTDTNNVIPFYYNNYSDFPSSSTYHGAVAHAHNTGRLYFAHAGWKELVNKESDGTVGTGTETYNVGLITAIGNNLVTSQWTLGASGSSHYTFTGPGNLSGTSDPVIYLARGQTYQFVNNSGGSHPFEIRTSNGGSAYSTGVTNNAAASGVIKFEVPFDAPNTLYYQCTNHAGMGGTVVVYPNKFTV